MKLRPAGICPVSGLICDIVNDSSNVAKPPTAFADFIDSVQKTFARPLTVCEFALTTSSKQDKIEALAQMVESPSTWPRGKLLVLHDNRTLLHTASRIKTLWEELPYHERNWRCILFAGSTQRLSAPGSDAPLLIMRALGAFDWLRGLNVMTSNGDICQADFGSYDEASDRIKKLPDPPLGSQ